MASTVKLNTTWIYSTNWVKVKIYTQSWRQVYTHKIKKRICVKQPPHGKRRNNGGRMCMRVEAPNQLTVIHHHPGKCVAILHNRYGRQQLMCAIHGHKDLTSGNTLLPVTSHEATF